MKNPTMKCTKAEACDFASRLASLQAEAFSKGLLRTGHNLHEATRTAGWEIEQNLELQDKAAKRAAQAKGGSE